METINEMPQEHLGGVLQIIREAAPVDENDDDSTEVETNEATEDFIK